jgi:uncharacterized membrane protein
MTQERFMAELARSLGRMTEAERKEILYDYEEHFRMGLADGKGEEEIARSLGNPRVLGKSFEIDALLEAPSSGAGVTAASVMRAIFASLSLTFFNVIFVLGPLLGLVGGMLGLWAAAISLPLAGLAALLFPFAALIAPGYFSLAGMNAAFIFFAGVGVAGLGVLAVIGMWRVSRLFVIMIAAYVRFNARIVTRRR